MAMKKMTPISVRLAGKPAGLPYAGGTGASQDSGPQQVAPISGAPITGVEKIDVATPPWVGIGKKPHNRPTLDMTEPAVPDYSGTGTNYGKAVPVFGGESSKQDNN